MQVLVAAQLGPEQREVRLVDAQVRLQPPVARIGQVVRRDLDRRLHAVVAVVEVELGPRARPGCWCSASRCSWRRGPAAACGAACRISRRNCRSRRRLGSWSRAPREPHRRAEVAGHVELPLGARLRGDHRRRLGGRRHAAADLRRVGRQAKRPGARPSSPRARAAAAGGGAAWRAAAPRRPASPRALVSQRARLPPVLGGSRVRSDAGAHRDAGRRGAAARHAAPAPAAAARAGEEEGRISEPLAVA